MRLTATLLWRGCRVNPGAYAILLDTIQLACDYDEQGFFTLREYFSASEIAAVRQLLLKFHQRWKTDNEEFYKEEAFNSSLITGSQYLSPVERIELFNFISSKKMMAVIELLIPDNPVFMNTQLFFNPVNPDQKDFWHRDCQYDHDLESQKRIIKDTQVVHLRVPLFDEPGMELIPKTHKRWDTEEEFNVRQELKGKQSCDDISGGVKVALESGDLLVFSADMIHRGIYGLDRLALDILVFDSAADYVEYIDDDCLPSGDMLKAIKYPKIYQNSIELKSQPLL